MIQLLDEIKSIGNFKVNINLHSEVQAQIKIKVIPEEVINNYTTLSPINNFNSLI